MKKVLRLLVVFSTIFMLSFSFLLTGCHNSPNAEELQALEESKAAALAAEEKQSACESEKAELEKQLAAKKQELQEMKQEQEAVSKRLAAM